MEPLVSVILPTYNRRHVLMRAVESVLAQSRPDFELIIVDDGSDDGTAELPVMKNRSERVVPLRLDCRCGVSHARNSGVAAARASLIAFIDSDDRWEPLKLEKQVQWMQLNPGFRICQTKEIWIRKGVRVNPPRTHEKRGGDIFAPSLERCMVTPSSVLLEKSLFLEAGGFNESIPACEDYDLWLRIACRMPVGLLDEYLLTRYGGHDDQLSSTVPALDRFRVRCLLDLLRGGALSPAQERCARTELRKKARIVADGFKKRGNLHSYETFKKIAVFW
jgi:glycosyltransferase involved in cell wall biosynthesis